MVGPSKNDSIPKSLRGGNLTLDSWRLQHYSLGFTEFRFERVGCQGLGVRVWGLDFLIQGLPLKGNTAIVV